MVGDLMQHLVSGWWPKILIVRQSDVDAFISTINPFRLQLQEIRATFHLADLGPSRLGSTFKEHAFRSFFSPSFICTTFPVESIGSCSVAIVCTILQVFSCYRVLKRLCCAFDATIFSRNQVQSRLLDDSNFDNPSSQNQSNALESTSMHSLPISQFKEENKEEPPRLSNTDCAVCLGEFEEGEWLRHLPNCTHTFHISCIDTWFQSHSSCPLCRSSVSDLTTRPECCVYIHNIREETLRREDFLQDRAAHYQMLRS